MYHPLGKMTLWKRFESESEYSLQHWCGVRNHILTFNHISSKLKHKHIISNAWLDCVSGVCSVMVPRLTITSTHYPFSLCQGNAVCPQSAVCCKRLIGEVVRSQRRPLLGPSLGWKRLLVLSHLRHYAKRAFSVIVQLHWLIDLRH